MTRGARDHWEEQSTAWIALTRTDHHYELYNKRAFLDFVTSPGRFTLDAGCGEGRLGRELAQLGHVVVGVDGSPTLAAAAARSGLPVALGDLGSLPIASTSVDVAVCFMVLMDVEDLDGAVRELARVLTTGGALCVAILHPLFTSGLFIAEDPNQTFYVGEYLREMRHVLQIERPTGESIVFRIEHRPLARYTRAFTAAGLAITEMLEPSPDNAAVAAHAEFGKFRRVPEFLYIRAARR